MSKYLASYLDKMKNHMNNQNGEKLALSNDIILLTKDIAAATESFLVDNNLTAATSGMEDVAMVANENYGVANLESSLGIESIESFVRSCSIPEDQVECAMETVGILLHKHMSGGKAQGAWRLQSQKSSIDNNFGKSTDLNTIFPDSIVSELNSWAIPSEESFGVNMDSALPDMKIAITVAMMRFHTSLTNRIMPTRPTPSPTIQYLKENIEVIDLSDTSASPKKVVDLYDDATLVSNKLKTIVPLTANDDDSVLVANGVLKFAKKVNLLELSIDATKPGYTKINATDTVADGAKANSVYISLGDGTDTEQFVIALPATTGRFTRPSNALDAAIRTADINYTALLLSTTKTSAGATSDILDTMEASEGLAVTLSIKASLNLKTGVVDALGSISVAAHHTVAGQDPSTAAEAIVTLLLANTVALIGYTMEAKHSEENLRKSNIQIRAQRQPFSFDIPTGRNYVYDYAIGQQNGDTNAAMLSKIIAIAQDRKNLDLIIATGDDIYDAVTAQGSNPLGDTDIGTEYIAGNQVRAYAYSDTIDISSITTVSSADRSGDIKQYMLTALNAICVKMLEKSFIAQQLPTGSKMTFKCITSGRILGNLLGIPHTHNHLNDAGAKIAADGVEYRMVLPSGIVIEVATTTQSLMANKIILIPYIPNATNSVLNFCCNWNYGTLVASYNNTSDNSAFNRLFANVRELTVTTCPLIAQLDITGLASAVYATV